MIKTPSHISSLLPYKPGKSISDAQKEFQVERWIKLASNENPRGLAPKALKGLQEAVSQMHIYPHPRSPKFLKALSKYLQTSEDSLIATSGVDSLLAYVFMAFVDHGQNMVVSEGSFIGTYVNAQKLGIEMIKVPLKNHAYDVFEMVSQINSQTKLVYIANPNNPTGTIVEKNELEAVMAKIPSNILVVLDEAYFEYAKDFDYYPNGLDYLKRYPNLLVVRTMSKAYGMAGLRVGYGVAHPDIIQALMKVKLPFEPAVVSEWAAAYALEDEEFLQETTQLNREGMLYFCEAFDRLGLSFVRNSYANFYMLLFDTEPQAVKFTQSCLEMGLIVRHLDRFGLPKGVRINTGTMEENKKAIEVIKQVVEKIKGE